jgi:hypothetical protein
MLRSVGTNISVITNFGCRSGCWYCIWKGHKLEHVQLDTDWKKLESFLTEYFFKGKVSVSGGGDCLYRYDIYNGWWSRFFDITNKLNMLVDVHSREEFKNEEFWRLINRCVFSSDRLYEDESYLRWLIGFVKVRIVHVATKNTSDTVIDEYLNFKNETGCQFTVKQLVGFDDVGRYKQLKTSHPDAFYLDAGDYNVYYMPDNSTSESFIL